MHRKSAFAREEEEEKGEKVGIGKQGTVAKKGASPERREEGRWEGGVGWSKGRKKKKGEKESSSSVRKEDARRRQPFSLGNSILVLPRPPPLSFLIWKEEKAQREREREREQPQRQCAGPSVPAQAMITTFFSPADCTHSSPKGFIRLVVLGR